MAGMLSDSRFIRKSTKRIAKIFLTLVLFFSGIPQSNPASAQDKTLKLPVTFAQPIYTTPVVSSVTEKYVIITNGFEKSYLDVVTGNVVKNPVKTNDFDWSTGTTTQVDENRYVNIDFHSYSEQEKYLTFEDTVIISREKGIAASCSEIDLNNSLMTIWDIGKQKALWDFKLQMSPSDIVFGKILVVDEYLIFSDQGQTMFFDLMTGKLRLVTRPVSLIRPQRWGKYLILDSQVIDLEQMNSVFDFTGYSFRLDKTGRIYLHPVSSTADSKWSYYFDLKTLELKTYEYKKPEDGRFDSSYTQGVCNGLFMRWNAGLMASEVVDPVTGKVYFSHPEVTTHIGWRGFTDNGRQIVFFDAAEIYCFDSVTKQVLWSKELISTVREIGRNYWWSPTKDPTKIRVFDITNQKKSMLISCLPSEWRWTPSVYPNNEFMLVVDSVSANDKSIFQRIDWDGSVTDIPELPDTNINLRLPFVYKKQIFAWVVAENNGILYKLSKDEWAKVMESPVSGNCPNDFWDRFFAFKPEDEKIAIFDLETGTQKTVDAEKYSIIYFCGSHLLSEKNRTDVIDPASCKVVIENAGELIGSDTDTLYFFKDKTLQTLKNGKVTQTKFENMDADPNISAANGFVLNGGALYTADGAIVQEDAIFDYFKLRTVGNIPCLCNDDHTRATFFKIKEALTYSLKMSSAGIVVTNLGKTNLKGKLWLEPFEGLVCKKLGEPKTIDIAPGKSVAIDIGQLKDFLLVSETNGLLSARDSDKSFDPLHSSNFIGNFDNQTQSYTDIRRIVVK